MTRNRLNPPDLALRAFLLVLVVALTALAMFLLSSAMSPSRASADTGGVCFGWEERQIAEYERTIVIQEAIEETEHQLAKHTRTRHFDVRTWSWGPWSEPVAYEPLSHEEWVTAVPDPVWQAHGSGIGWEREWALLPTGMIDTVLVQPLITETETTWSDTHPGGDWTATGATDVELVHVERPCPEQPPVEELPVEEPPVEEPTIECPTGDEGYTVDVDPSAYDDCPPIDAPEPEQPADPPVIEPEPQPEVEVVTAATAAERTLPRTGIKEDIASAGLVLLFVGGSLLGLELYDRRKRRA